jgi:hypothetical protein
MRRRNRMALSSKYGPKVVGNSRIIFPCRDVPILDLFSIDVHDSVAIVAKQKDECFTISLSAGASVAHGSLDFSHCYNLVFATVLRTILGPVVYLVNRSIGLLTSI